MSPRGLGHVGETAPKGFNRQAFRRVLGWLAPHRRQIVINVSLTLALTVIGLATPKLLKWTVDGVVGALQGAAFAPAEAQGPALLAAVGRETSAAPAGALAGALEGTVAPKAEAAVLKDNAWRHLRLMFLAFGGLFLVELVIRRFEVWRTGRLAQWFMYEMRQRFFNHLHALSLRFYERIKSGQIIARGTSDMGAVEGAIEWAPNHFMSALATLVFGILLMLQEDRLMFLAVAPIFPVLVVLTTWFRKRGTVVWRDVRTQTGRLTANLAESIAGARVIQAFARERRNMEHFAGLTGDLYETRVMTARVHGRYRVGMDALRTVARLTVILFGGYRVSQGAITPGTVLAFLVYEELLFRPIEMLSELYNQLLHGLAGAERILEVLDAQPDIVDAPNAFDPPSLDGDVEFDHVTFEYNPGVTVLHDVSFRVRPGQTVALVGPTGAGKTTVCRLIARFYETPKGQVRIDGRDVRSIAQRGLHRHMGIVLQENFLFAGTVMDNIRYGRPDASDAEVVQCAHRIGSHRAIEALTDGYQTEVGERGEGLSAGQRQLVCFTRAMLAEPRILILDEATSSVDTQTELAIQQALGRLTERRTSFIVAHRLSTVRKADRVLVIESGRITEAGTHQELLARGGPYATMYTEFIRSE